MSDDHIDSLTENDGMDIDAPRLATATTEEAIILPTVGSDILALITDEEVNPEPELEFGDPGFVCKDWSKIRKNRAIVYELIEALVAISRFVERNYRYDDILSIIPNLKDTLEIKHYNNECFAMFNHLKLMLVDNKLPATETYRAYMEAFLSNLRFAPTNYDKTNLAIDSIELKDYLLVNYGKFEFHKDDGVDIPDNCPPPPDSIMNLELRRPFCTEGFYDMSADDFKNSYCFSMHPLQDQRFKATPTHCHTPYAVRTANDIAWLRHKSDLDEQAKLMHPKTLVALPAQSLLSLADIAKINKNRKEKLAEQLESTDSEQAELRRRIALSSTSSSHGLNALSPYSNKKT